MAEKFRVLLTTNSLQDLTVGFNGFFEYKQGVLPEIEGFAQLYGVCTDDDENFLFDTEEPIGILLPLDDQESTIEEAWIVNTN